MEKVSSRHYLLLSRIKDTVESVVPGAEVL